eukprot:SAG22_NODE_359_length_11758_cov_4.094254_17_plen_61_part_00
MYMYMYVYVSPTYFCAHRPADLGGDMRRNIVWPLQACYNCSFDAVAMWEGYPGPSCIAKK